MENNILDVVAFAMAAFISFLLWRVLYTCWVLPIRAYRKLAVNGFSGPPPSFPLGNIADMKKTKRKIELSSCSSSLTVSNDIHSSVFPYFAQWQKDHGSYHLPNLFLLYIFFELCFFIYRDY